MLINIISLYLFAMIITVTYCAAYIRSLIRSNYTFSIMLLCLAVCLYMFGYSLELNSTCISQILFWNGLEYIGIPFVSALWLSVGLIYTGYFYPLKKWLIAAIYLIPLVTLMLRYTNDYHHLYFSSISFANQYGRLLLVKHPGPWMYVQMIHSMSMVLITLGLLVHDHIKRKEEETRKFGLMIASSFFAVAGLLCSIIKPFGIHLDYMALLLPVTCIMIILAIMRYDFLVAKAMARNKVFEVSSEAILLVNHQNMIIDYNKCAKQFFEKMNINISEGYMETLLGCNPELLNSLNSTKTSVIKLSIDSEDKFYEITTKDIDNHFETPHGWIKRIQNVTEIYELNEYLKKQAMMDELSGLLNRRAFMMKSQRLISESNNTGNAIYLLMMDLDHFKSVNDQYGHQMGDAVIHGFGEILKNSFHENALIARLGGEEFAVLLSGLNDSEIKQTANQVLRSAALFEYGYQNYKIHVTVSIGIAKKSSHAQILDNLINIADKALYLSKSNGRNCVTGPI